MSAISKKSSTVTLITKQKELRLVNPTVFLSFNHKVLERKKHVLRLLLVIKYEYLSRVAFLLSELSFSYRSRGISLRRQGYLCPRQNQETSF